jgi:putative Holliday junction resolvase
MQIIASGLTTVSTKDLISFLKDYFAKEDVELIVIGEPKQKDGTHSDVEVCIKNFIIKLVKAFPTLRIERMDERFTSKIALKTMIESGLSKKKRQNKSLVDEISATIILQDYLKIKQ